MIRMHEIRRLSRPGVLLALCVLLGTALAPAVWAAADIPDARLAW